MTDTETTELNQDTVQAICERHIAYYTGDKHRNEDSPMTLVESLAVTSEALPVSFLNEGQFDTLPLLSERELRNKQLADPCLREIIAQMETGEKVPPTVRKELCDISFLLRELNRFELHNYTTR